MARRKAASAQERKQGKAKRSPATIWTIAGVKVLKGLILLGVAVGALTLLNENVAGQVRHWIADLIRDDPYNPCSPWSIPLLAS